MQSFPAIERYPLIELWLHLTWHYWENKQLNQPIPATKQKQPEIEKILFQRQYRNYKGQVQTKTVKQVSANQKKGETVYSASDMETIFDFFVDLKTW